MNNKKRIKTKKKEMPVCPICKETMVPSRQEYEDGSGWRFGWICGCTDELRNIFWETKDDSVVTKEMVVAILKEELPKMLKDEMTKGSKYFLEIQDLINQYNSWDV